MGLAEAKSEQGNTKIKAILMQINNQEETKTSSIRIKYVNNKIHSSGITKISVQNDEGGWIEKTTKRMLKRFT